MTRSNLDQPLRSTCLILTLLVLTACQPEQIYTDRFYSFGTIVEVSLISNDANTAEQAMRLIQSELRRMHNQWHAWQESELTKLNHNLQQQIWFSTEPELYEMVALSREFYQSSDGLFDPAIGGLINAWGFHRSDFNDPPTPETKTIADLQQQQPSMSDIEFDNTRLRGTHSQLQLDLGGLAKGYGLGKISEQLQQLGVTDFILNAGGDVVASGEHGHRAWKVGIRGPEPDEVLASINTQSYEAVFSSGNYERYYETDDGRAHHLIDPRNAQPATSLAATTVLHQDPSLADAAATALLIAGTRDWRKIAKQMGITTALVIEPDGKIHLTDAMRERVRLNDHLMSSVTTDKM